MGPESPEIPQREYGIHPQRARQVQSAAQSEMIGIDAPEKRHPAIGAHVQLGHVALCLLNGAFCILFPHDLQFSPCMWQVWQARWLRGNGRSVSAKVWPMRAAGESMRM